MTDMPPSTGRDDETWRRILTGEEKRLRRGRHLFGSMPAHARCKNCNAPFTGWAGGVMRLTGRVPYPRNPRFCNY